MGANKGGNNVSMHQPKILSECEVCTVESCADCGVIHLHIGTTSLRFRHDAYILLCQSLLLALARVAPDTVVMQPVQAGDPELSH